MASRKTIFSRKHAPEPPPPPEPEPPPRVRSEAQNIKLPADLRAELREASIFTGIPISKITADGIRLRLKELRSSALLPCDSAAP